MSGRGQAASTGSVRLEQTYRHAFGNAWVMAVLITFVVASGTATIAAAIVGDRVAFGMFMFVSAAVLGWIARRVIFALRDTTRVSRSLALDRASGTVNCRGVFGLQTPTNAAALIGASLTTWREENGTLVLQFGDRDVVMRTGEICEATAIVEELSRAKQRLSGGPPIMLEVEPRAPMLDEVTAHSRRQHRHNLWLAVDDRTLSTDDEIDRAVPVERLSLVQSPRDLYANPIQFGVVLVVALVLALPQLWSSPRSHLVATGAIELALVGGLAVFFAPLALNARLLTIEVSTGEMTALRVRRRARVGNIAGGLTVTELRSPLGATLLSVRTVDGRAVLRGDLNRAVDRWLVLAGDIAERAGSEVVIDLGPKARRKVEPTSKERGVWQMTVVD